MEETLIVNNDEAESSSVPAGFFYILKLPILKMGFALGEYETLVTHFDSPLYFESQIAQDLGIPENTFQELWRHTDRDRTIGKITLEDALEDIMRKNECYSEELLNLAVKKRIDAKNECFAHLNKVFQNLIRKSFIAV